uniref:Uncharacterized protein n=1 Tax=Leersia perrieri TaxID=77586 RepID=A0A0D9UXW7_9ORYZ
MGAAASSTPPRWRDLGLAPLKMIRRSFPQARAEINAKTSNFQESSLQLLLPAKLYSYIETVPGKFLLSTFFLILRCWEFEGIKIL